MNFNKEDVLDALPNCSRRSTPKNFYMFDCPYCGKERHAGITFETEGKWKYPSFNCFKCDESGSIFKLLKFLDRLDLIDGTLRYDHDEKIENRIGAMANDEVDLNMPEVALPVGFKRVKDHWYLRARGFTDHQFDKYHVGTTTIYRKLRDYVIFLIKQDGKTVGYVARSTWYEEDIEEHNENLDEGDYKHLKYLNTPGVDFSKALFGYDEITDQTHSVILVEGITDKFNVERKLRLDEDEAMVCCCTFGKKVSLEQRKRLALKNVSFVILMYDPDAIEDSKRYALELDKMFDVRVAFCRDRDPGDMSFEEISEAISNSETPHNFNLNKVQKKKLT